MKNFKSIFYGVTVALGLTMLFLLIFSLILAKTNFNEKYIDSVITIISAACILISTSLFTRKIKKSGAIVGAIISLLYSIILYVLSSIVVGSFSFGSGTVLMIAVTVVLGVVGGIIGINLKKS